MHYFYTPGITDDIYTLPEEELHHAIHVMRVKTGDLVGCMDGAGNIFEARVSDTKKTCLVQVTRKLESMQQKDYKVHIALAPTKNMDRMEWFTEKAVEIGMDELSFVITKHCERKVIKNERIEKIAIAAMKQSLNACLPKINPAVSFHDFIQNAKSETKCIATCEGSERVLLKNIAEKSGSILIIIGPEGDFTAEEIKNALHHGYKTVSLGNSRLRTETAALVACHTVSLMKLK